MRSWSNGLSDPVAELRKAGRRMELDVEIAQAAFDALMNRFSDQIQSLDVHVVNSVVTVSGQVAWDPDIWDVLVILKRLEGIKEIVLDLAIV